MPGNCLYTGRISIQTMGEGQAEEVGGGCFMHLQPLSLQLHCCRCSDLRNSERLSFVHFFFRLPRPLTLLTLSFSLFFFGVIPS